jgi:hypothetical protein
MGVKTPPEAEWKRDKYGGVSKGKWFKADKCTREE